MKAQYCPKCLTVLVWVDINAMKCYTCGGIFPDAEEVQRIRRL